jgi:protein-tyrosine phosphatase
MVETSPNVLLSKTIFAAMKILMVCLGNICRSPLAEGILQHKAKKAGLDITVDSAGTGNWHTGSAPDARSVDIASLHGLDISAQRARSLSPYDLEEFDRIFAMDSTNYQEITSLAQNKHEMAKVQMIMNLSDPGRNINVPDPYYDSNGFETVYQMLNEACDQLIKELN